MVRVLGQHRGELGLAVAVGDGGSTVPVLRCVRLVGVEVAAEGGSADAERLPPEPLPLIGCGYEPETGSPTGRGAGQDAGTPADRESLGRRR